MDRTYRFYPHGIPNPFINTLISTTDDTIVFDGYFYLDAKDLPVERIMVKNIEKKQTFTESHIEIYEKISGKDTSSYCDISGSDCDEENICFFPTEITTLKYRVIKTDLTREIRESLLDSIKKTHNEREQKKIDEIMARTRYNPKLLESE